MIFATTHGTIYQGDCIEMMKQMPDNSIDCCITSPPYWGLRDYGHSDQLGLEPTPDEYIANMVKVFHEVKRILKTDGTLWLNIGDTYAGSNNGAGDKRENGSSISKRDEVYQGQKPGKTPGSKPKELVGIPWKLALALSADMWYLRQDIIWSKPNPMPESVKDRCTKSHEYLFLLTKRKNNYYYDYKAIREPAKYDGRKQTYHQGSPKHAKGCMPNGQIQTMAKNGHERWTKDETGEYVRNKRSVWTVQTNSFKDAHFATFPIELITPCIKTTRPGATILDPFMGSGTTAIAAIMEGRKYIGTELNPEYCKIATTRILQHLQQTTIFEVLT